MPRSFTEEVRLELGEIPWADEEYKGFRQREHLALKLGCV